MSVFASTGLTFSGFNMPAEKTGGAIGREVWGKKKAFYESINFDPIAFED